jgi:hypothetical protein
MSEREAHSCFDGVCGACYRDGHAAAREQADARVRELEACLKQAYADVASEQRRRVAAQEAIVSNWGPALREVLSVVDNCCQCVVFSEERSAYVSVRDGEELTLLTPALLRLAEPGA